MKSKSSYLFVAFALGLVAMIIWTASLAAQQAASPNTIKITQPTPSDATRFEIQRVVVPQSQNPTPTSYGARVQGQAFPGPGVFPTLAMPPDAKTAELIGAYLLKQSEINQLVKKYGEATAERDKNSLRDGIVQATAAQFDLRQQVRTQEIERLKQRLADVEATVQNRNELKDKIVEKRVADILREPDQLGWEPLGPSPESMLGPASGVRPNPYSQVQVGPIAPVPKAGYVPRIETRILRETTIDAKGNPTIIERPVLETVYEAVEGEEGNKSSSRRDTSRNEFSPDSAHQSDATWPTVSDYRAIKPSNITVAEAEARVRIAEQRRDLLVKQSREVDPEELQSLDAELALARVMLARAQAECAGRTKLLELDVRQAESVYEQATAVLTEAQEINKRAPHSFPSTQMGRLTAAVEQSRIQLERAKTILDIHLKSNASQAEVPGPPAKKNIE